MESSCNVMPTPGEYPYVELDRKVTEIFFPEEPLRQWAFDRRLAARVVDKILFSSKEVRDRFNQTIDRLYEAECAGGLEKGHDLFLLWAIPYVICLAAVQAYEDNHTKSPQQSDMGLRSPSVQSPTGQDGSFSDVGKRASD